MIVRTHLVDLQTGERVEAIWTDSEPWTVKGRPVLVTGGVVVNDTDYQNEDTPVLLARAWDDGYRSGLVDAYRIAEERIRGALRATFPDLGGGK